VCHPAALNRFLSQASTRATPIAVPIIRIRNAEQMLDVILNARPCSLPVDQAFLV
jgi:hypothetical protein